MLLCVPPHHSAHSQWQFNFQTCWYILPNQLTKQQQQQQWAKCIRASTCDQSGRVACQVNDILFSQFNFERLFRFQFLLLWTIQLTTVPRMFRCCSKLIYFCCCKVHVKRKTAVLEKCFTQTVRARVGSSEWRGSFMIYIRLPMHPVCLFIPTIRFALARRFLDRLAVITVSLYGSLWTVLTQLFHVPCMASDGR